MIKFSVAFAALVALPLLPAAAATKPTPKTAATRDWSRAVVMTPEGGFRMGNPAAKVKVVEYGSLACPHCRHFEETGYKPLVQKYVRGGQVSYEFRNLLLNGPDISVSLLTRCSGPANFFPMSEVVYATQPQWEEKIQQAVNGLSDAQKAEMEKMTDQQRVMRMADVAGFRPIAARFGFTPALANRCLADPKGLQRLLDITQKGEDLGVKHTPTFIINGKISDAALWEELEPELRKAGA